MTRDETKKIIRVISATYPNFHPADLSEIVDIWTLMLEEYSYADVSLALKSYVLSDSSGFAPSVGQLTSRIANKNVSIPEPLEAWSLVYSAISRSIYGSEEEFKKLPEICQKAIGNPANLKEMAMLDTKTVQSVEQSHFIRSYESLAKRYKEEMRLPCSMRIEFKENNLVEIGAEDKV